MDKTPVAGGGGFGGHEGLGGDMDETPTKKPRKTPANKKQQPGKQANAAALEEEAAKEQVGQVKMEAEDDIMDEDEAV